MAEASFDYVIVGAGSAGCLLANRLSTNPKKQVLLIEAGGRDNYHWIHIPVGYLHCIGNPRTDWLYHTTTCEGLGGRRLRYPRGKVLGGSSSINGMIYMRGQARDYNAWATTLGDNNWLWEQCLPYFQLHENHYGGANNWHGATGVEPSLLQQPPTEAQHYFNTLRTAGAGAEWAVAQQRLHWPVLDAFAQAAVEAGVIATTDFNRGDNAGVAYFDVNQRKGWRWNTSKAFLRPVESRPNLTVWTESCVDSLILEGTAGTLRCRGLAVLRGGEKITVKAHGEVLLAAGSIGSVAILERSGVGDGTAINAAGGQLRHSLPGVGRNLQDHLQIRLAYRVAGPATTLNSRSQKWWGRMAMALEYALKRSGPMSMAPSQLGIFAKSHPQHPFANLQYHIQPLSLPAFGEPLDSFDAITASVCNLNPSSRGSVHIQSPDPLATPLIDPNYLSTTEDQEVALASLRLTRHIASQAAFASYTPEEVRPGNNCQTDEALLAAARQIATTIFHPAGTTKMGNDALAVVDSRLRLHGITGLRVVDAGVMPTIPSGNINSPTLMIAEKAAQWIATNSKD